MFYVCLTISTFFGLPNDENSSGKAIAMSYFVGSIFLQSVDDSVILVKLLLLLPWPRKEEYVDDPTKYPYELRSKSRATKGNGNNR